MQRLLDGVKLPPFPKPYEIQKDDYEDRID
jgi:hypothetical protein